MNPLVKQHNIPRTLTFYCDLIDYCLSSKSLNLTKVLHAQLIKVGLSTHTFLGNRCLELYTRFQCIDDISRAFGDIIHKNTISWNIFLKGLFSCGCSEMGISLFQKMPEKDVVSWNSMISWHASCGHSDFVWRRLQEMLNAGVKPNSYSYSILVSMVSDVFYAKELHGSMIRNGAMRLNVVLGNSLINMYGKIENVDYAFGVFFMMEHLDVISWNSLIMVCWKNGCGVLALNQFSLMRSLGFLPDEFTYSSVITCCTYLRSLEKGNQIFTLCTKVGLLCNSIISSAIIDLFSKCNRLEHSVKLFQELGLRDPVVCNSMISSYTWNDTGEEALKLFVIMWREGVKPTGFSLSSILSSLCVIPVEQGTQIHSLVIKLGYELDSIVNSSLIHMYAKFGCVECAINIFASMVRRDLISWNTMIMGLTYNGKLIEAVDTFKKLCTIGLNPDHISLAGVMLACSYGDFIDEGMTIFSEMERCYGVTPSYEHYTALVDLLCRAGRVIEAIKIIERMPYRPNSTIWTSLLCACLVNDDVELAEEVAEQLMDVEQHLSLPYFVLASIYEMRGQWEDSVRVKKTMRRNAVAKVTGCSCIAIKNSVYTFKGEYLQHHAIQEIYSILKLLAWESSETITMEVN